MGFAEGALRRPARLPDASLQSQLRFYNPSLHVAAFALPGKLVSR